MGRKSRDKGKRGELEAAELLRRVHGFEECCRRASGSERFGAGGNCGRDLENAGPLCVQVKCDARPQPLAALAEAQRAAKDGEIPCAIVRQSSRRASTGWAFVFAAEDALLLLDVFLRFRESFPGRVDEIKNALTTGGTDGESECIPNPQAV